ncbi:helix-turn-helix domain-containing protein [Acutalibacter muris]|uniref:helix-turn-helix domain-containing protein n=1 Tax=Acutalibacter muris TaxID=1796620 RepID=UPI0020CD77C0|nr:helix-turn-helix domain-containing protein [Acutalibacter muris]
MTKKEREKELRCYPAALTAAEVAEILRVSIKTVYKLIKDKTIPAVKVGRENRIAKSQFRGLFVLFSSRIFKRKICQKHGNSYRKHREEKYRR